MPLIEVYLANLRDLDNAHALSLLDASEIQRAARISHLGAREEFIKSRALLRTVLGKHSAIDARALVFQTAEFGKPFIDGLDGLHFNLSHSGGIAMIGVSPIPVGEDIERIDEKVDIDDVAISVFRRSERDYLAAIPHPQRRDAFFRLWARKEAYLKATGNGFSSALPMISTLSDTVLDHSAGAESQQHAIFDLAAPELFKAALVTTAPDCDIRIIEISQLSQIGRL